MGGCDLQIEIGILLLRFESDTPCHVYDKGGGSLRAFRRARLIDAMVQRKSKWEEDIEEMTFRMHAAKQIMLYGAPQEGS